MNKFEQLIQSVNAKPAAIVHLGAGWCREYEYLHSLDPERIIFVEPDPQLVSEAQRKFKSSTKVSVIASAIAPDQRRHTLKVTNNKRFSSLLSPTKLLDFYPNIEVTDEIEVDTLTIEQLCVDEKISEETDNLLIVELQGLERQIIPYVSAEILHRFKWIVIRSSKHALYKAIDELAYERLTQAMQDAGYIVLEFGEDAPPFANILCIRNDAEIENARLIPLQARLDKKIRALNQKLRSLQKEGKTNVSKLEKIQAQTDSLTAKNDEQNQYIEHLSRSVDEKAKELSEMQRTLQINNKLTLKSESNLKNLQIQYQSAHQNQAQQHKLLVELKEKLRMASEYYQKLDLQKLVLDGSLMDEDESVNSLTADAERESGHHED